MVLAAQPPVHEAIDERRRIQVLHHRDAETRHCELFRRAFHYTTRDFCFPWAVFAINHSENLEETKKRKHSVRLLIVSVLSAFSLTAQSRPRLTAKRSPIICEETFGAPEASHESTHPIVGIPGNDLRSHSTIPLLGSLFGLLWVRLRRTCPRAMGFISPRDGATAHRDEFHYPGPGFISRLGFPARKWLAHLLGVSSRFGRPSARPMEVAGGNHRRSHAMACAAPARFVLRR